VFPRFDTLVAKTDSFAPDPRKDLEKMARRGFQSSKPFKEGTLRWLFRRQDEFDSEVCIRKRKRVKLAPATVAARERLQTRLSRWPRLRHGPSLIRQAAKKEI
jgi:hypothetical protein